MKKYIIRTGCFLLIFIFLFLKVQTVLHYRWSGNEALYTRNIDYASQLDNSIDVLCFGTSELYAGYDPIITYREQGITGYNFAISHRSSVTVYYQLLYALKYQTPKIVICDFSCLYDDLLPGEVEQIYRKVVDTMPDKQIKNQLIKDICLLDDNQSYLSWKFPLLRYHSMWNELTEQNFLQDYVYDEEYPSYSKGALLYDMEYEGEILDIVPELWNAEPDESPFSDISVKYYDMFIEECQKRNIKVVAVIPPKIAAASLHSARWDAMKEYFDSRNVDYLNYNTYEAFTRMTLNLETDYYNIGHLNIFGSIKFSKILADDLTQIYNFSDEHKDTNILQVWNAELAEFEHFLLSLVETE